MACNKSLPKQGTRQQPVVRSTKTSYSSYGSRTSSFGTPKVKLSFASRIGK